MYLQDLSNSTEIVLGRRNRVTPLRDKPRHLNPMRGSASRAAASALRLGNTVSAALTDRRVLGASEAGVMMKVGLVLTAVAIFGTMFPRLIAVPVGIVAAWIGLALVVRAWKLRRGLAPADDSVASRSKAAIRDR